MGDLVIREPDDISRTLAAIGLLPGDPLTPVGGNLDPVGSERNGVPFFAIAASDSPEEPNGDSMCAGDASEKRTGSDRGEA